MTEQLPAAGAATQSAEGGSEPGVELTCLFCRIVAGEIPAKIVAEGGQTLAFRDIAPASPTHILVIPKRHYDDLGAAVADTPEIAGAILAEAARIAEAEGLVKGYRVVINTGRFGGQTVNHLHAHLLGGRPHAWPPG